MTERDRGVQRKRRGGFTLLELVVVVGVMMVLLDLGNIPWMMLLSRPLF